MAIVNVKTDITDAFEAKKRIRTQNYRGSLLNTSAYVGSNVGNWIRGDAGSVLYIAPIAYMSSIKNISIDLDSATSQGRFDIGVYPINKDGTYAAFDTTNTGAAAINKTLGSVGALTSASIVYSVLDGSKTHETIYQMIESWSNSGSDIEKTARQEIWKQYNNDKYCMLGFRVTTAETTNTPNSLYVNVQYVEGSPSESPLTDIAINSRATPIA